MKIQERSFSGKLFQPIPKCYTSVNKKTIMTITAWGNKGDSTEEVFNKLNTQYNTFLEDKERTHPFPKILSLTPTQNNIRTSIIQVNEEIFNNSNSTEYSTGFELFFGTLTEDIFTFVQIGQPLILLKRRDQPLRSIGQIVQPSTYTAYTKKAIIPPLPNQLLGIHEDILFSTFLFRFQPQDSLILLNRNTIPNNWFTLENKECTLKNLTNLAVKDNPQMPFWLAIVDL